MTRIPSYRLHRASGQAVVTLNGKDHYLGRYDTPSSHREYDRIVSIWIASGRKPVQSPSPDTTVSEIVLGFLKWADEYYRKGGRRTSQFGIVRAAVKDLVRLFGREPARDFGPIRFETLRSHWVKGGLSRDLINRRTKIVRQVFAWATGRELVPGETYHALRSIRGLSAGRTTAPETPGVGPVPEEDLGKTLEACDDTTLRFMIKLQYLTGMRPGELVSMRPCDIDTSGDVWTYRPPDHKTVHRDRERVVYIGPKGQIFLFPFLANRGPTDAIFRSRRNRPMSTNHYRIAIAKACKSAAVDIWTPNRLRHNYATMIRTELGLEASKVMLGHCKVETTQIYAEADARKAADIARRFG